MGVKNIQARAYNDTHTELQFCPNIASKIIQKSPNLNWFYVLAGQETKTLEFDSYLYKLLFCSVLDAY